MKRSPIRICGKNNILTAKTDLEMMFSYFFFRYSHRDQTKLLCMDILCLATWTWTTISTLIWQWDHCLILSLFTGTFTATAQNECLYVYVCVYDFLCF